MNGNLYVVVEAVGESGCVAVVERVTWDVHGESAVCLGVGREEFSGVEYADGLREVAADVRQQPAVGRVVLHGSELRPGAGSEKENSHGRCKKCCQNDGRRIMPQFNRFSIETVFVG